MARVAHRARHLTAITPNGGSPAAKAELANPTPATADPPLYGTASRSTMHVPTPPGLGQSERFSSAWINTISVLLAKGRARVSVADAATDWPKRIRDMQYLDHESTVAGA